MQTYSKFKPTEFDVAGKGLPERQDWFVAPCGINRDADLFTESNWYVQLEKLSGLEDVGAEELDIDEHQFGHWANGWYRILLVRPGSTAHKYAEEIEEKLKNYSLLDEDDLIVREEEEASKLWETGYTNKQSLQYIRDHRSDFSFNDFLHMLAIVRGKSFGGSAYLMVR